MRGIREDKFKKEGIDTMLYDENMELWNGSEIIIKVEDRYLDSGEILLSFDDTMDWYTESFILSNLIVFRDKINEAINICNKKKQEDETVAMSGF